MRKFYKKNKKTTVLRHVLTPMSILILLEAVLLIGGLLGSGVIDSLNKNAYDTLQQRIDNRVSYLENQMNDTWSNISEPLERINNKTEELLSNGSIDIATLDDSSKTCEPLLLAVYEELIGTLRNNKVTGAFIVLNTEELDKNVHDKPGIYIRDLDPTSQSSKRNADLLFERAPAAIVQNADISTDKGWTPMFEFAQQEVEYYSFLYYPFQTALMNKAEYKVEDLGYWSSGYHLSNNNLEVISYSVPLMLEDGTVYGVMGIDISFDYLQKIIPYQELIDNQKGSYVLALGKVDELNYNSIFTNGIEHKKELQETIRLVQTDTGYEFKNDSSLYCAKTTLDLYNRNTPFFDQQWQLMAVVDTSDLLSLSNTIIVSIIFIIALALFIGIAGSFFASYVISNPIVTLSHKIRGVTNGQLPILDRTNIKEIDYLVDSIEALNESVVGAATKFTKIIQMASTNIAGFMINEETDELFITDNFFEVFGMKHIDTHSLSTEEFTTLFTSLDTYASRNQYKENEYIYRLMIRNHERFIKLLLAFENHNCYGLTEDITASMNERKAIEYERDHDLLTGLINARAFKSEVRRLFKLGPHKLKVGALVMMDLDNLKAINDTHGHDCGDMYIKQAAEAFSKYTPANALLARISGDEFNMFLYGYDSKEEIRDVIMNLKLGIDTTVIYLPNHHTTKVYVSGGIAWYPDDSKSFDELQRFSDYAMYKVKHSTKGEFSDFDLTNYNDYSYFMKNHADFLHLIEEEAIEYYFQPIVDLQTGEIFAYEALMRSLVPSLKNPLQILTMAKMDSKLAAIEELTWNKSLSSFKKYYDDGTVEKHCKVFINSISSQIIAKDKLACIEEQYQDILKNVVLEVIENEENDALLYKEKQEYLKKWHAEVALDDYGSGYNSDLALLAINPNYIKIDMEIIRHIDVDKDKQEIVSKITQYAHERKMKIIAEGVETANELQKVIQLNIDYVQGFIVAKPAFIPPKVSKEALKIIMGNTK